MNLGGIELDIRWTQDDHPVIFHDPSLHRLHKEDSLISEMTFLQLRQKFPQILLLNEVLEEFSEHFHFMIEIKTQLNVRQEEILTKLLSPLKPIKDYHLLTLNPDFLSNLKSFPSETFILVSELNSKKDRDFVIHHQWGGYASHYLLMTSAQLKHLKSNGIQVGSGYINSLNVMRREEWRGLDWHFSNKPHKLINNLSS
jgi:glycerophosphoryl diester phosphodiesterase